MSTHKIEWTKLLFWSAITFLMYWGLLAYSGNISAFAHATPANCIVTKEAKTVSYVKLDAQSCEEKGGRMEKGNWYFVLIPILIAFGISYAHGTFTSLFWDAVGLKPATKRKK